MNPYHCPACGCFIYNQVFPDREDLYCFHCGWEYTEEEEEEP